MIRRIVIVLIVIVSCCWGSVHAQNTQELWPGTTAYESFRITRNPLPGASDIRHQIGKWRKEAKRFGIRPHICMQIGQLFEKLGMYDSMNVWFDSAIILEDNAGSVGNPKCGKRIADIRKKVWDDFISSKKVFPLRTYLDLAIWKHTDEPFVVRQRNNLARLFAIYDKVGSLPKVFFNIGKMYRTLGTLDSMNLFFDSTLIYCADNSMYYSERKCCDEYSYQAVIDSLRDFVVGTYPDKGLHVRSVIFYDSFSDNINGWPEGRNGKVAYGIGGGRYAISLLGSENLAVAALPIKTNGNYVIRTKVKYADGKWSAPFGLIWGSDGKNNFYMFAINEDGLFTVKALERNQWVDIISWQKTWLIRTGHAYNELMVKKDGGKYRFFVNGEEIGVAKHIKKFGEYVGFVTTDDVTFSIDYLLLFRAYSFGS